ncbi:MAG: phosphate ABC transporter substrate-binding protein [Clostridia bacterium]|nr:phosphate ABC transporter substrate-binding protein [Clostridia bacterium]
MKLNKRIAALGVASMLLTLTACGQAGTGAGAGNAQSGKITIEGSTSMQKMVQELADTYTAKNPKVTIEIIADGSSAGIKAANENKANIGMASRDLKDEEKKAEVTSKQIAWDAIAIVVNNDNGVTNLSKDQIAKIYTKEITNWKDVGGKDAPIVVIARDTSSGTREAFDTLFGVKDKIKADQEAAKTGEVKTLVSQNPNAIGYVSLTYVDQTIKAIDVDTIKATEENVKNNTYTIKRPFNILVQTKTDAVTQAFVDFIYSEEGKAIISKEALPVGK